MFLRKLYIKLRLFFYSSRHFIDGVIVSAMILTLLYLFMNFFVFERVIIGRANYFEANNKYEQAIELYNFAYAYYDINHFTKTNRDIYFEIPYRVSMCYLKEGKKEKSIESMIDGMTLIQRQYGVMSLENAYFIRKYLIEYYLNNNKNYLARQEFDNLLLIYKAVGYTDNEMSDIIRLSGDLYYQQGQYDTAMSFYEKAYKEISKQNQIDYDIFAKIVTRICAYEIVNGRTDNAVNIYTNSINILKNSGKKQDEITADLLLKLGDLYSHNDDNEVSKKAIPYYEEAIALIKTLPNTTLLKSNLKTYLTTLRDLYNKNSQFSNAQQMDGEITKMQRFSFLY